ncbi:hypothetical protein EZV77_25310 [Burkholderia thailandensis]|nr:hypothetical protein EZV77_25310 [Burkholderia thailandensis]TGB32530.1 hypothetical protein C6946_17020 [Burkholderia thailandensis]
MTGPERHRRRTAQVTTFHRLRAPRRRGAAPAAPGCAHGSPLAQPSQTVEKLSTPCCKSVLLWKHFPFWRN